MASVIDQVVPPRGSEVKPMSYSDFTLETVDSVLGIRTQEADLFSPRPSVEPPAWLIEVLSKRTQLSTISEKARSEFIVAPILLASRELSPVPLAIFSGQRLDVDPARGLVGECDFLLAIAPAVLPLRSPIASIVEAKKNDIDAGLGQCVAQMIAARIFNESSGKPLAPVYGCVTTGEDWQFLKLDRDTALIDRKRYYLDNVGAILAVLQAIVSSHCSATTEPTSSQSPD